MRALILAALVAGCGDPPIDPDAILASFESASGLTFADCGEIEFGQCYGSEPTSASDALAACVTDAAATCAPVRASWSQATIEGAPIVTTVYVVGAPEDCRVVMFIDSTADTFGSGEVERLDCQSIAAVDFCPFLLPDGCAEADVGAP